MNIKNLSSKERKNALNEVRILASLDHPQIISYKDAFFEESTCSLCIVMEFAEGGDLQQLINKTKKSKQFVPEQDLWKYCIQMINGIKYLHEMKIVHRDLKVSFSSNLLFINTVNFGSPKQFGFYSSDVFLLACTSIRWLKIHDYTYSSILLLI